MRFGNSRKMDTILVSGACNENVTRVIRANTGKYPNRNQSLLLRLVVYYIIILSRKHDTLKLNVSQLGIDAKKI